MKSYKKQYFLYREIDKYRKEYKINVFMGVYSGILPLYFYLKKRKRKIGIIFSDMDSWFDDVYSDMRKYWYKTYNSFNYALENADIVDFLSPFILDGVKKKGITIPEEKISITPCSFTDYSKCKIGNKREFQIAFSGRLEGDKNPLLFVEAARLLLQKYPDLIFHIIGEGRLGSNIREKVEGFDNIIYHGFHISPTDILAESSVFVSIQSTNNYPSQSVLEAMACGNAIIATDVGDTRMFINKNNGILINLELNELVNAIGSLYLDKILRERLGKYAFSYVREKHSLEKSAEYYITLFNKTSLRYID